MGEEALRRYLKLKPPSFVPNRQEVVHDIRKTVGGAICDPEDCIKDVLDDNDFVSIGDFSSSISSSIHSYYSTVGGLQKNLFIFRVMFSTNFFAI